MWDGTDVRSKMKDMDQGLADLERTSGDVGTAILLALEALPDGVPFAAEAEKQLALAWQGMRERLVLKGHGSDVWSAAFRSDGRRIVTASSDRTARLWDADTGNTIGEPLKAHDNSVLRAAFTPDGRRIVTASQDRTARLWDAETGRPLGEPLKGHENSVSSAAFDPDGKRIVTASEDRTARLWDVESTQRETFADTKTLMSHAKTATPRCLTTAQRRTFRLPPELPDWCVELEKWPYHTSDWKRWLADIRAGRNPQRPSP